MLDGSEYGFSVDWWALGILIYEMIVGFPPFYTGNRRNDQMFKNIKQKEVYLDVSKHGIEMTDDCKDFIKVLLKKDPKNRLGSMKGFNEVLDHRWISDNIDHDKVKNKRIEAPYLPDLDETDILNTDNFDSALSAEEVANTLMPVADKSKVNKFSSAFKTF